MAASQTLGGVCRRVMTVSRPTFLFGTTAYNAHAQNMALALHEAQALYTYLTGAVDSYRGGSLRSVRRVVAAAMPRLDRELARRRVTGVPAELVRSQWRWDLPRVVASRLRCDERAIDWLWEREEFSLDQACARIVRRSGVAGFVGVEFGALRAIEAAARAGKPSAVAFLSPHHATHDRWVHPEYEKFPELRSARPRYFDARDARRNARRDREAACADWIVTGSSFTTKSLISAGVPAGKILTVPLAAAASVPSDEVVHRDQPTSLRVVFVGPASVRKGAHYLLRAWERVARSSMELHFYGAVALPDSVRRAAQSGTHGATIVFHGSVPAAELRRVYLESSVLVLPTLCDGFGQVVSDALAHGLPVITTTNAGAADVVEHGKNGLLIPPADEDALAASIAWCAEHRHELTEMRAAALASSARWTWADFRRRFSTLLLPALDSATHAHRGSPLAMHAAV